MSNLEHIANPEHFDVLKQGVQAWNRWRKSNPNIQPNLRGVDLSYADLRECNLFRAHLEGAFLQHANLGGANLREAHLEGVDLQSAHLEGTPLLPPVWEMRYYTPAPSQEEIHTDDSTVLGADLRHAFFDSATNLTNITFTQVSTNGLDQQYFSAFLADIVWNDVNVAVVDWTQLNRLGDELLLSIDNERDRLLSEHRAAIRAYRQLAIVLQSQGLNEFASHYMYRAKVLERRTFLREIRLPSIMKAFIEGNKQMIWNWGRVVQGDISVFLGEPARQRKQASFLTLAFQAFLSFLLIIPLSTGSLAWGGLCFIWQYVPWKRRKEKLLAFLKHSASWLVPVLVLIIVLIPCLIAFLLFPSFQSGWKPIVPVSLRSFLSLTAVLAAFYGLALLAYFRQYCQAMDAYRHAGKEAFAPRVSIVLLDRLYVHVLLFSEVCTGYSRYIFSLFLDIFAGYGYKLGRSFCTYICIVGFFALLYHVLDPRLAWNEALVISMIAFHGRGFLLGQFQPNETQVFVSALEAFVGLIIEVTFIATLTQRFFEK